MNTKMKRRGILISIILLGLVIFIAGLSLVAQGFGQMVALTLTQVVHAYITPAITASNEPTYASVDLPTETPEQTTPVPKASSTPRRTPPATTSSEKPTNTPVDPPTKTSTHSVQTNETGTPNVTQTLQAVFANINQQFQDTFTANIAYNAPKDMKLDETVVIELLLNPAKSQADLATEVVERSGLATSTAEPGQVVTDLGGAVDITTNEIQITDSMKAVLKSQDPEAFLVQDLHDNPIQPISSIQSTKWRWSVTAKKEGPQTLEIVINQLVKKGEAEYWVEVESYRADIKVKVTAGQWLKGLDWYWIAGTILIPVFLWWWNTRRRKPEVWKKNE